ncbi:MAG TPA: hypothetical protein VKB23_09945 [Solirubrobacterales bacterium]|nr:hypothetical protein [Solirubrobacterales bacterium]
MDFLWAGSREEAMMDAANRLSAPAQGAASASEVFERLGEQELAAIHALERNIDGLDEIGLASEARLGVSAAVHAAKELSNLGLVEITRQNDHLFFRLIPESLRRRVEEAPAALFS